MIVRGTNMFDPKIQLMNQIKNYKQKEEAFKGVKCWALKNTENGNILKGRFESGIHADRYGLFKYGQAYEDGKYKPVEMLPDGRENKHAVIQVYSGENCILENHYKTEGGHNFPYDMFNQHKEEFKITYPTEKGFAIKAWCIN